MSPRIARRAGLALCLLASCHCALAKKGKGGGRAAGFDAHHKVMQLLTPQARACEASPNGTVVGTPNTAYALPAYCPTKLPKKRQCTCLSFGTNRSFGSAMATIGCKTVSFDLAGGPARQIGPNHAFVPADLSTHDGLAVESNITIPVLSLQSIIDSLEWTKVDLLRFTVSSIRQWKLLKNLVNTGAVQGLLQLSLNVHFADMTMWSEYQDILTMLSNAGFKPFYIAKQPDAIYLQVQEGTFSLFSKYEVSLGNVKRKNP